MRPPHALRWVGLAAVLLAGPACRDGDLGLGLAGCDFLTAPEFPRNAETTIAQGFRGGVTRAGVEFLTAHRELLFGLLFEVDPDGFVHLPLPDFAFGGEYDLATRDVRLRFDLRAVDFEMVPRPDPARLHFAVREARLALEGGVLSAQLDVPGAHGDAACYVRNGIGLGTREEGVAHLDLAFDVELAVGDDGGVRALVSGLDYTLHDFGFELDEDMSLPECDEDLPDPECAYLCSLVEAGSDVGRNIYETFQSQIDDLLRPALQDAVDAVLNQIDGQPLALVGRLHLRLLTSLLPSLTDAWPLSFLLAPSPGGFAVQADSGGGADGAELTLDVGLVSGDHPCVPPLEGLPPVFAALTPPPLGGLGVDGLPYHVGFTLTDAVVNRATWVAYRAGALCLLVDQATLGQIPGIPNLDSSLLDLALPGLPALTRGPRPILIAIDPAFEAADFDLIGFRDVERAPGDVLPRAGLDVRLPHLGISFYVFIEDRWMRVFSVRTDVALALEIQTPTPTKIALAAAQPQIGALELIYDEPVQGQNLDVLLELILDLAQSALLRDGLAFDLPLSGLLEQLTGIRVDVGIVDLSTSGNRWLTMGLRLADTLGPPPALRPAVETTAALVERAAEAATLAVSAPGTDRPLYQWRYAGGPWSPLRPAPDGRLTLSGGRLTADAAQVIEVRAVDAATPATPPDPTPARLTLPSPRQAFGVWPASGAAATGCATTPGRPNRAGGLAAPVVALLLLLPALARRRRTRSGALVLVVTALVAALVAACGEPGAARRTACLDTAECPGGLVCLDGFCEPVPHCATREDCCPGSACQQGVCLPAGAMCAADADCLAPERVCLDGLCHQRACGAPSDCPPGVFCVGGFCHAGPPCGGRCGDERLCFADLDVCAPVACPACPPGQIRLAADPGAYRGPVCDLDAVQCACVTAPPVTATTSGDTRAWPSGAVSPSSPPTTPTTAISCWSRTWSPVCRARPGSTVSRPTAPWRAIRTGPDAESPPPGPIAGGTAASRSMPRAASCWPTTTQPRETSGTCATTAPASSMRPSWSTPWGTSVVSPASAPIRARGCTSSPTPPAAPTGKRPCVTRSRLAPIPPAPATFSRRRSSRSRRRPSPCRPPGSRPMAWGSRRAWPSARTTGPTSPTTTPSRAGRRWPCNGPRASSGSPSRARSPRRWPTTTATAGPASKRTTSAGIATSSSARTPAFSMRSPTRTPRRFCSTTAPSRAVARSRS
jgi:hypothetical protein